MYKSILILLISSFSISLCSCQEMDQYAPTEEELNHGDLDSADMNADQQAVVTNVVADGSDNNYTFKVTVKSPDTGCNAYADWWEIFDQDGNLLYRRILTHSHVDEQPFTRSGNGLKIGKDQFVYVRAHMSNTGYSSYSFSGTPEKGFKAQIIGSEFYPELETAAPQPKDCTH